LREEYTFRINRVLDYIERNIDKTLSLAKLADVASFSRFHFHRIFAAMVGETTNQFIQRLRINKAAGQLAGYPNKSITAIALDCGFSGSATFARAFRDRHGMSASEWRDAYNNNNSNISKMNSNNDQPVGNIGKDYNVSTSYNQDTNQIKWRVEMKDESKLKAEVVVKDIPEFTVAYIRHTGPYMGDGEQFGDAWAAVCGGWLPESGYQPADTGLVYELNLNNPEEHPEKKHIVEICIPVKPL